MLRPSETFDAIAALRSRPIGGTVVTSAHVPDLRVECARSPIDHAAEMTKNDVRDLPAYSVAEAARYLKVAPATLRSWVAGRPYPKGGGVAHSPPLIHLPRHQPPALTFWNLIEAHVLRSLRTEHGVSMDALRKAIAYALNRDEFLALFGPGVAEKVYSPVPAQFMDGGLTQEQVEAAGVS